MSQSEEQDKERRKKKTPQFGLGGLFIFYILKKIFKLKKDLSDV